MTQPAAQPEASQGPPTRVEPPAPAAPPGPPAGQPEAVHAMAQSVGQGMTWMMLSTGVGRIASFLAQWALGYLLFPADFGLVSITVAVATFVQVFRDGGIPRYVVQQGPEAFRRNGSTLFWMALAFNGATAATLAIAAPFAGRHYHDPRIGHLLLIMALVPLINTPSMLSYAKLNMEMRFTAMAKISAASAVIRHGAIIVLAWAGLGVYALIVPLVIAAAFDSVAYSIAARLKAWKGPAHPERWAGIFRSTGWLMVGSIASSTYNMGEYLVLPAVVSKSVQGVYYFGYQLSKQIVVLVLLNLQAVLLPALSRVAHDPERHRAAILRALRLLMMLAAPISFGLVSVVDPLVRTLWTNGVWNTAIPVVQVLAAVMALNIMAEVPRTVLMSAGRFRLWSGIVIADMLGLMAAAVVGGWLTTDAAGIAVFHGEARDPFGVALAVGCYSVVATSVYAAIALRAVGVSRLELFQEAAPALLFALLATAVAMGLDLSALRGLPPALRLMIAASIFAVVFLSLARRFLGSDLRDVLSLAPGRLRPRLLRMLRYT